MFYFSFLIVWVLVNINVLILLSLPSSAGQYLDYRSYVVNGSVRGNPALERSVMMCNGVSQWVQLMILSRHTAQQRAHVFTKFIHVAQVPGACTLIPALMTVLCSSTLIHICTLISPQRLIHFIYYILYINRAIFNTTCRTRTFLNFEPWIELNWIELNTLMSALYVFWCRSCAPYRTSTL